MSVQSNNKRVAKNTAMLYIRMIVIILVNLYTTRVVLEELGEIDYGIYNVVGGVVLMFSFISSSMTTTTQRYLTYELGRGDHVKLGKVFSMSLNIHIAIAIAIVLLAETVGLWFLNTQMTIPATQMTAANWVYQFSILSFCVNIIQVPYNATLIAHEKMNVFAYISILEAALKLGVAYALIILSDNKLIAYAALVFLAQLIIRGIYQIYCRRNYAECAYHWIVDRKLCREMTVFAGWNLLGSIAWLFKLQGVNILLNIFFGPIVNAAQGIANQVRSAIMGFVFNFMSAVNPQITKYYASGELHEMETLSFNSLKYSYMLLLLMALPIMLNIDYILTLWLEEVPAYTSVFIILVLADSLCNTVFDQPLMTTIAATGRIKWYQIITSGIMLILIPASYIALKLGAAPPSVFYLSIIITLISGFARFWFCKKLVGYKWGTFIHKVLGPCFMVTLLSLPLPFALRYFLLPDNTFGYCLVNVIVAVICVSAAAWTIGLSQSERSYLTHLLKSKLHRV